MPSAYSPEEVKAAVAMAAMRLKYGVTGSAPVLRYPPPNSPLALAELHSRGKYSAQPQHLAFLNQALVYLAERKAPAWFLRKLTATTPLSPDLPDDEMLPFRRLLVQMPPRHGKSVTTSQYFASWFLGTHPDERIILTSYEDNFARSWGRKARDVLREYGHLFGVKVSGATSAADEWEFEGNLGGMLTAGIGGAITGRGGNLIYDDPVKNAAEAKSQTIQQRNIDWFWSTAYTRLEPEGFVLGIQTRWDEADLTGAILSGEELLEDEEVWYTLNLPAIAEQNDPLGREIGEALWPARYSLERLEAIKRRIGAYFFSALYQQRPTPIEGGLFKRGDWQWYDEAPERWVAGYTFVDTAGYSEKTDGDWVSYASVVRNLKDLFWLNANHGHWTFPQLIQRLKDEYARYKLPIVVEDVPWARPVIQTLRNEIGVGAVVPFEIKGQSKEVRATAVQPYHEAGNFYLPRRGQWTSDFVDEHAAFPNGAHDDWVDTTSMAGLKLLRGVFAQQPQETYRAPAPQTARAGV